jgi:hypothetical protein
MKKCIASVIAGCAICVGLCAITSTTTVAEDRVDCSKLAKFESRHTYKNDERVWFKGSKMFGAEYRCKDGYCVGSPTMSAWEMVAECRPNSEPK